MGTIVSLDTSKMSSAQIAALQAAGVNLSPGPAPDPDAGIPAAAPAAAPASSTPAALPAATATAVPQTLAQKILASVSDVAKVLETGVAGPQAAEAGAIADVASGTGSVIWQLFNPATNKTSQHASLSDAVNQAAVDMHTKQAHAVATKSTAAHVVITPAVKLTAADVAAMPTPVIAPKTTDSSQNP